MKTKLKGFTEGTIGITTGDKMKEGDHTRHKARCIYNKANVCHNKNLCYTNCVGSSHCDYYYDGIATTIINNKQTYALTKSKLDEFIKDLKFKINFDSLEGELIQILIKKEYKLKDSDIQRSDLEIKAFQSNSKLLYKEINEYNKKQYKQCYSFLSILFNFFNRPDYNKNVRDYAKEYAILRSKTIDSQLEEKVKAYRKELEEYVIKSTNAFTQNYIHNINDEFYIKAQISFKEQSYDSFCSYIIKSIQNNNVVAIIDLADKYKTGNFVNKNNYFYIYLHLYASYLGYKHSSKTIANYFAKLNPNSTIVTAFLKKASL